MKEKLLLSLFASIFLSMFVVNNCIAQHSVTDKNEENVDALPSIPFLPDPLIIDEGTKNIPVVSREQWRDKSNWIKEQYKHWISGTVPPAPASVQVKVLSEKKENGVLLRMVELAFGPGNKAKLTVELMIPPGQKPLPVFMTQWNHRGWAQIAVRRGYIGCVYAGADAKDDTRNYTAIFPGYCFSTLMIRAWAASRAVDYLYRLPEVDTARIGITGHSRNGKQSLLAAAFDERIKAVVSSSGGTGGENPFRYTDESYDNESIDDITKNFPDWFHPRLRLFIGKEQKLPVDQNSLMSVIAPRGLLLSTALTETEGGPWGIEQAYKSAKKVYQFEGAEQHLGVIFRNGRHATSARDIENYIDFFDYIFGRTQTAPENRLYYDYSFEKWKQQSKQQIAPLTFQKNEISTLKVKPDEIPAFQEKARQQVKWLLGDEPPGIPADEKITFKTSKPSDDFLADVIMEPVLNPGIKKMIVGPYNATGEYLWSTIYFPPGTRMKGDSIVDKLPLVIFLHEYAHGTGYRRRCETFINAMTQKGFAVLGFDMMGYGTRIDEFKNFYNRYPQWSVMGKMVADTRLVIRDAITRMRFIDKNNIFLAGYSLGGTVALLTAALDSRVKGTAVASAFGSLRIDNKGTEGIRQFSHLHGLLPRLGFFVGNENRIPVDFDEILAAIAPENLMVIAPEGDRYYPAKDVANLAAGVSGVYTQLKASSRFIFKQPATYNHFTEGMQKDMAAWFLQVMKKSAK